jgi:RHH-type rel operon transcriptional repressor/antitoxin RelB
MLLHDTARDCTMSTNLTVRLEASVKKLLDQLAKSTGRSRSYLAQDALRRYVEDETWQIAEIGKAVKEADAGDFASDVEVTSTLKKWRAGAR